MIYAIIALIAAGVVIALLAIIVYIVIRRNSRLERERGVAWQDSEEAQRDLEAALAGKEALKDENADLSEALETTKALYNKVLRERNELVARATALQEAMEARPTQPTKRAVPKRGTQATEQ